MPFVLFVARVGMIIWVTERLLEGLVGLAYLVQVSICHRRGLQAPCR